MAARRPPTKSSGGTHPGASGLAGGPAVNAAVVVAALAYGVSLLVDRGRLSWPPHQLLASLYTVAGCLAVVGPVVLARGEGRGGLGELLWMTAGLLVWVFDAVALARGDWRTTSWVTPLGAQAMGLTVLAVGLAGWRCDVSGKGWTWSNVTGWVLGLFWVAMALTTVVPARAIGLAAR